MDIAALASLTLKSNSRELLNGSSGGSEHDVLTNGHAVSVPSGTSCEDSRKAEDSTVLAASSSSSSPKHAVAAAKHQRQPLLPTKPSLPRQRTFDRDSRDSGPASATTDGSDVADATSAATAVSPEGGPAGGGDPLGARLIGRRMIPRYVGRSRSATAPASVAAPVAVRDSPTNQPSSVGHKPGSAPVRESQDRMSRSSVMRGSTDGVPASGRNRRNSEQLGGMLATSTERLRSLGAAQRPTTPSMSLRLDLSQVQSKCGSMLNISHTPRGGNVQIVSRKLEWKAEAKVGSLENSRHTPRGGDKKIESLKLEWKAEAKVGSLTNVEHKPTGGDKKILSRKLHWDAEARVGSLDNANHKPGGGDKKIDVRPVQWEAKARVGSLDNAQHQPGGGAVKIESHKVNFRESATPKTDSGLSSRKSVGGSMTGSATGSMTGSMNGSLSGSDDNRAETNAPEDPSA